MKRNVQRKKVYKRVAKSNNLISQRTIARIEAKKVIQRAVETKIHDTYAPSEAIDYTNGYIHSVTETLARGTAASQYIGDKIQPVGLAINLRLTRADSSNLVRVLILQDRAGGIPIAGTVFSTTANVNAPLSFYEVAYNDTYTVLYDKLVTMDNLRNEVVALRIKIPGSKLKKMSFNNSTGNLERGGIFACFISDSAATAHPVLDMRTRFYYKDA